MSSTPSTSGNIIRGLQVERTPQGHFRVMPDETLLIRTTSGRVRPWRPDNLELGEGIQLVEEEGTERSQLRPRRLFEDDNEDEREDACLLPPSLAAALEVVDSGSEVDDEELTVEQLRELLEGEDEDEEEVVSSVSFTWSDDFNEFRGVREVFQEEPGPRIEGARPIDVFTQLWDQPLLERIVQETNRYAWNSIATASELGISAQSRTNAWVETTVEEIYRLIGIMILMGMCVRGRVDEYWSTGILGMPGFRTLMSRDRFCLLMHFLHFVDNDEIVSTGEEKKIGKIQPIVDYLNEKYVAVYTPRQELSIDESLLLWKGRLSWWQSIRSKAARFGIKSYELCESVTGYVLKLIIYTGKSSNTVEAVHGFTSASAKAVLKLMTGFLNKGYTLFMDNWYNSVSLTRFLKNNKTDVVGTLNRRRIETPADVKSLVDKRVARGSVVSRHCGDVAVMAWKDVKLVTTVSTYHNNDMTTGTRAGQTIQKPVVVSDYNKFMGGVDLKDQKLAMYLLERKRGTKWYIKVFRRLINISILNSYTIFISSNPDQRMTHRQFRYKLAAELAEKYTVNVQPRQRQPTTIPGRLNKNVDHFPEHIEVEGERSGKTHRYKRARCARCVERNVRTSFSNVSCSHCKVFLCVGRCWREFHTLE